MLDMTSSRPGATLVRIARLCEHRVIALLVCAVASVAVYAPALRGGLIWDDIYLVGENPFFKSPQFGLEVFRHWLFFDSFSTYYRPVQNWSYMLDYWLWQGSPVGYHLTNVGLHATAAFLLYLLLRQLLPTLLEREAAPAASTVSAGTMPLAAAVRRGLQGAANSSSPGRLCGADLHSGWPFAAQVSANWSSPLLVAACSRGEIPLHHSD
jgi:hypothetical protein